MHVLNTDRNARCHLFYKIVDPGLLEFFSEYQVNHIFKEVDLEQFEIPIVNAKLCQVHKLCMERQATPTPFSRRCKSKSRTKERSRD